MSAIAEILEAARTMSPAELQALWARLRADGDREARDTLLTVYEPLVRYVARRVGMSAPTWVDRREFVSYGYLGLVDAVDKFSPERGVKFETYATRRIRGAILDGLRHEDPLSRNQRRRVKTVYAAADQIWEQTGHSPTESELVDAAGVDAAEVRAVMLMAQTMPEPLEVDPEVENILYATPEEHIEYDGLSRRVAEGVSSLGERERAFVALYYGARKSLTEVGRRLGVSDARVGQIRLAVVNALRRSHQ